MFNSKPKHGYVFIDPITLDWLVSDILAYLGYVKKVKNDKNIFRNCLNPDHPYHDIMISKVQLILEIGCQAYLIALNNTFTGKLKTT
jgi:hypothetical protein